MQWEEFVTKVAEDLPALMEEKGYDIQTKRQRVEKLQADTYDAVAVTFGNQNIGMLYRLEEDYAAYQRGMGYGDILDDICDAVIKHWDERVAEIEIPKVLDYGWAKPRLILQLVETERNKDYLKRCPHQEFHEFSMVCRVEAMVFRRSNCFRMQWSKTRNAIRSWFRIWRISWKSSWMICRIYRIIEACNS